MNGNALRHCVAHEATADLLKLLPAPATEEEKRKLFSRILARLHQALAEIENNHDRERRRLPRWWN